MKRGLTITPAQARTLFLRKQRLSEVPAPPTAASVLDVVRSLRCVQLDPISVVARSHRLVLYSRLGQHDPALLDQVAFAERHLFEYWAHCASLVLTEDYPIHRVRMRETRALTMRGVRMGRLREWVAANARLKRHILSSLRRRGPLLSRELEEAGQDPDWWISIGWAGGRNVSRMLDYLWIAGDIMVAGRQGGQKVWDLTERVLPTWTPPDRPGEKEVTRRAIGHSLRALGVGTEAHIKYHFVRGRYPHFRDVLARLLRRREVHSVRVEGWPGTWFIHDSDVPRLDEPPTPRTTLLSPFDNLIADRARTSRMFDFDFRIEIYVPEGKRKFGYYVLPILHNGAIIGRADLQYARDEGVLHVHALHAERGADPFAAPHVVGALRDLAKFLGGSSVALPRKARPKEWKRGLASLLDDAPAPR
ncbi:MAG: YcaQ family DNA glycosylase [Cytophagaceae bacterium]|nr:YcaQ family DNA glycosylase [Gemmatimonadaceae bacterium]